MYMNKRYMRLAALWLSMLFMASGMGCSHNGMVERSVRITDSGAFPAVLSLSAPDGVTLDLPSMGIMEIRVADTVLVVSVSDQKGFWHLYSLPGIDSIGRILDVGQGPNEFLMPLPCGQASFTPDENGHTIVTAPFMVIPRMVEFALSPENMGSRGLTAYRTIDVPTSDLSLWAFRLDSDRILVAEALPDENRVRRRILRTGTHYAEESANKAIEALNARNVSDMSELPLLLTSPAIRPDGTMVAEIPGFGNGICVYDTGTGESVTIEYADRDSGRDRQKEMMAKNMQLFNGGIGYENYFAVLRNNYSAGKASGQSIDFFGWDGRPLATVNLPDDMKFRRFDIDRRNSAIYCLDGDNDRIVKFKVGLPTAGGTVE